MENTLLAGAGTWNSIEVPHESTRSRTRAPQLIEANMPAVRIAGYTNVYDGMYPTDIQLQGSSGGTAMVRTSQTSHSTRHTYHYDPEPQSTEHQLAARQFTNEALASYYQPNPVNNNEVGEWVSAAIWNPTVAPQSSADWVIVPAPAVDMNRDMQGVGTGVPLLPDSTSHSTWEYIDEQSEARGHHRSG